MTAILIDGKASAAKLREKIAAAALALKAAHGLVPGLATVLVGNDPASEVYVRNKRKTAEAIGFKSVHVELPADVAQAELLSQVKALSADPTVHGILVQLPLPKHLDEAAVLDRIGGLDPITEWVGDHPGLLAGEVAADDVALPGWLQTLGRRSARCTSTTGRRVPCIRWTCPDSGHPSAATASIRHA